MIQFCKAKSDFKAAVYIFVRHPPSDVIDPRKKDNYNLELVEGRDRWFCDAQCTKNVHIARQGLESDKAIFRNLFFPDLVIKSADFVLP